MDFNDFMRDLPNPPRTEGGKRAYKNIKKLHAIMQDMQALKDISEKTTGEVNIIHPVNVMGSLALMTVIPNGDMGDLFSSKSLDGTEEMEAMDRLPISAGVTDEGVSMVWHNEDTDEYYIVTGQSDFRFRAAYVRKGKIINTWPDRPLHDHVRAVWQMTNTPRAYR